jgi:hypothetical protein
VLGASPDLVFELITKHGIKYEAVRKGTLLGPILLESSWYVAVSNFFNNGADDDAMEQDLKQWPGVPGKGEKTGTAF